MSIDNINAKVKEYKEKRKEWERNQSWHQKSQQDLIEDIMFYFYQLEPFEYSIRLPKNSYCLDRLDISSSKEVMLYPFMKPCHNMLEARIEWLQYLHSHMDEILLLIEKDIEAKMVQEFDD